ncbi:hypothetical protein M707_25845 [Arthrobacter sp. AK-YN10]|nr:hypothetical protein M707_25845 [Arthrobacter sp. AK-YN10]
MLAPGLRSDSLLEAERAGSDLLGLLERSLGDQVHQQLAAGLLPDDGPGILRAGQERVLLHARKRLGVGNDTEDLFTQHLCRGDGLDLVGVNELDERALRLVAAVPLAQPADGLGGEHEHDPRRAAGEDELRVRPQQFDCGGDRRLPDHGRQQLVRLLLPILVPASRSRAQNAHWCRSLR